VQLATDTYSEAVSPVYRQAAVNWQFPSYRTVVQRTKKTPEYFLVLKRKTGKYPLRLSWIDGSGEAEVYQMSAGPKAQRKVAGPTGAFRPLARQPLIVIFLYTNH